MSGSPRDALNRRTLLKLMGGGCALAATSSCTIAEVFGVTAGGQVAFNLSEPDFAPLRQIGGTVSLDVQGRTVLLIRVSDTRIVALNRSCTHEGFDLSPDAFGTWDGQQLTCRVHNSRFNADGAVVQGPAGRPLTSYPVTFDPASGAGTITFGDAPPGGAGGAGGDDDDDGDVDEGDDDGDVDEGDDDGDVDENVGGGGGGGGGDRVPSEFRDLVNPVAGDPAALAAGQARYAETCTGCHGTNGEGNSAFPMPQPSAFTVDQSGWSDGYLFWRLKTGAEGGPGGSIMPNYGSTFSDAELWELVTYIRSLAL